MTYDGKVKVGGPPQMRVTEQLEISKLAVGQLDNNCYLLRCRTTGATLLIDAAAEPDRILELCDGSLDAVLTTHRHADHWQALADVVGATNARTYAHPSDAPEIPIPTDVLVSDADNVEVGSVTLTVAHLVGHTPGSIALIHRDHDGSTHAFTGDSLFPGGLGRTTTPEQFASLLSDVTLKLFTELPDDSWVYPGHGFDTTLGAERPELPEWKRRGW